MTNPDPDSSPVIGNAQRADAERQIERLIRTYCHLFDGGDFTSVAEMFADARWQLTPEMATQGAAQKLACLTDNVILYDGKPGTRHLLSNTVVDVAEDGRTATAMSYVHLSQVTEGFPLQLISQARYDDAFALVNGQWRFTSRTVLTDGTGDMSHHQVAARDAARKQRDQQS